MFERDKPRLEPGPGGSLNAFLGRGSRVTGTLVFEGPVRIEGYIEGEIAGQDALTIGESAVVKAPTTGTSIIIHGRVTGEVTARERLEIRGPAKVFGSISTPSLVVQGGAVFEGQCAMGGEEAQRAEKDKDRKVALVPKEECRAEVPAIESRVDLGK
jgi:cytoskeletal protein CcmA (bactofilin family)